MNLDLEKNALIQEIHEAFADVDRKGGMSWRDSMLEDMDGAEHLVTYVDQDARWQDLAEDPTWNPGPGIGGFAFLDPIGFRYHLPAAMIKTIKSGYDEGICFHLTVYEEGHKLLDYRLNQLSLIDGRQGACIRRFIKYMIAFSRSEENSIEADNWKAAYSSYWVRLR
jgi:hypothetical protein